MMFCLGVSAQQATHLIRREVGNNLMRRAERVEDMLEMVTLHHALHNLAIDNHRHIDLRATHHRRPMLVAEGVTILLAEQNVKFAMKVSSDCYILERGAIVHHEETAKISEETRKKYLGL